MKFIALNDKTESSFATKIVTAIIINFIYYRHSLLNVFLPLFQPDASHSVFFTLFQAHPADLCYLPKTITVIHYTPLLDRS
ncbi:hypothetical protein DSN16_05320 [Salmonella enterica subsp. enterica serovar Abony]|uniref:Uncharacterized protein n=1 Tax=Salmonella abony TaxID=29482 RepID=A0A5V0F6D2_SALAB|nr:hypothetical protein [Salmonella enterica subsp. enterica serovar Abony]EBK4123192.1 hypothetical protein [Salmonella enterica]EAA5542753.1 hypothetical protein [Salmonella enterica subsp. enterica serovar Abony]EBR0460643.1 hypothetical protein [Salmonella enterica subsp. enterica serovar Abony]EBR9758377.1 hypothetical protein [Salmonella enterica subsp. enterica serovar Abony]